MPLGAVKWDINERALQGHECLDFLGILAGRAANAFLHRLAMLVLDPARADEAEHGAVQSHTKPNRIGRVALDDPLCQSPGRLRNGIARRKFWSVISRKPSELAVITHL